MGNTLKFGLQQSPSSDPSVTVFFLICSQSKICLPFLSFLKSSVSAQSSQLYQPFVKNEGMIFLSALH